MSMRRLVVSLFALALVVGAVSAVFAAPAPKAGWPSQLKFMAGPPGGNWFALGNAFADMWSREVLQTTSSSGGGVANIINADTKKGDLGFSVTSLLGAAIKGEQDFLGRPVKNAVVMANLYTQYTYFIMRKDFAQKHGITKLGDVFRKKVPVRMATLKPGTASEFVVKSLFMKGYGVTYKDIKKMGGSVEFASYDGGADLLADNHIDMFAFSVGKVASIVMNIESNTNVVILPVDDDALKALSDAYGTETFTINPGIYKSVTKPVKTVGDYTCVVIRKDLPENLVYELCKALWKNKDNLAKAVQDMKELNPKEAIPKGVPAHPGAVRFWKEAK
ncbi:TRAP transporter solute receptor, TAXI family [Thermanaerovibrio acidaminovorans DSM 6589]|uniref:TRAP transporter solute receptor, TAXI family n=2 Tax=Thermanaerovibrio TaxID=81461 RepID=D1B6Q6_THEAS|nr:TRAP transporter solute receptor, TAXI family [Thermanaerovibrio acidaminovorans DSM 6589]